MSLFSGPNRFHFFDISIFHLDALSRTDFFNVVERLRPYDLVKFLTALNVEEQDMRKLSKEILGSGSDVHAMQVFQKWKKAKGTKATRQAVLNGLRRYNNVEAAEELIDIWNRKGNVILLNNPIQSQHV